MSGRLLAAIVLTLTLTAAAIAFGALRPAETALVELAVGRLTCVSCAGKIEEALSGAPGVRRVAVDVAGGRAQVEYEPARIDPAAIAGLVSRAGYPAGLRRVIPPAEYRALQANAPAPGAAGPGGCGGKCCGGKK